MEIVVDLTPEVAARLREKASKRGQDFQVMAAELIQDGLSWEEEDLETSIAAIQAGLDDFEAGRFQSLESLVQEKRQLWSNASIASRNFQGTKNV
jgi:predicted transcriptional regulator